MLKTKSNYAKANMIKWIITLYKMKTQLKSIFFFFFSVLFILLLFIVDCSFGEKYKTTKNLIVGNVNQITLHKPTQPNP